MPFGSSVRSSCNECGDEFHHLKKLSEHIKKVHKMSSVDYYVKHNHGGKRPMCLHCGQETRFVSLGEGFKKYCKNDRKIAESTAGRIGGSLKKTWNKGLTKHNDDRIKEQSMNQTGQNNHFYGKKHTEETKKRNADAHRLSFDVVRSRIKALLPSVEIVSDNYVDQNTPLTVKCQTCSMESNVSFFNLQRCWRCRTCYPIGSRQQLEVVDYVRSLGFDDVVVSTRDVIPPYELDVWVPSRNVAIEYHGLYWHSGGKEDVFDKKRHREKYIACKKQDIKLMQFFSDEWIQHNEVCMSMIANALGAIERKIAARKCTMKVITTKESAPFLNANHISNATRASVHLGLYHGDELVSVATLRTPIQTKRWGRVIELARLASLNHTIVQGGASRLLKEVVRWAKENGYEGVLSYSELRYGDGDVYKNCGFDLVSTALNNYWYTDGEVRFNRFKYRAQPGKTEKQVADENNVRPVYGCGNNVYLYKT